jgi:hypothetical protein
MSHRHSSSGPPRYSSRIIKAGALLEDTRTVLLAWDPALSPPTNLDRVLNENLLGKASRSRVVDELAIFRQRYFSDPEEARALAILAKGGWQGQALNCLLFYLAARSDRLLRDIVLEIIGPMFRRGQSVVRSEDIEESVRGWIGEGRMVSQWSEETVTRVAQGSLAALRDFGLLRGAATKRIAPPYVPPEAAAAIAFLMYRDRVAPSALAAHPDWGLFLLNPDSLERLLLEAHQRHLLDYHAAGRLVRLGFPAATLEEYACALVKGATGVTGGGPHRDAPSN